MRALSGHTRPFAVLGHPIGHTLSPIMHNAAFEALGLDAIYLAFDVHPERLMPVLEAMKDMGFAGVNLTVPLKEVAFNALPKLDESARLLGAVNTVAVEEGAWVGYNTDGYGFLQAIEESFGRTPRDASCFVLGTGGAGRAVALVSAQAGAASIALADIDEARARRVADEIRAVNGNVRVSVVADRKEQPAVARSADLVVHATPVGMKAGEPALLEPDAFREGQDAFDLIYHLPETPFMRAAAAGGAKVANGLGMLLHQGAKAFTIWTQREAPVEPMRGVLQETVYSR